MAFGNLNLPVHLIPWQQHGLDYILAKENLPLELSVIAEQQKSSPPNISPSAAKAPYKPAPSAPNSAPVIETTQKPKPQKTQQPPLKEAQQPPLTPEVPFMPLEHWPSIWQDMLQKTTMAPVVWTYWSLGDDLCGKANAERRNFMRTLLKDLAHPKGTHTFWPAALPNAHATENIANAQVFWSGVQMLKARAVVVMGQPATKALGLAANLRPFMHTRYNGCFVVVLRDVDFLISEPHHYANVREFLRRSLANFARKM